MPRQPRPALFANQIRSSISIKKHKLYQNLKVLKRSSMINLRNKVLTLPPTELIEIHEHEQTESRGTEHIHLGAPQKQPVAGSIQIAVDASGGHSRVREGDNHQIQEN
jgi:hypothetical protein